jgi:hypothetical protein
MKPKKYLIRKKGYNLKTFIIVILIFLMIMILIDGFLFDEMKRLEHQLYMEKKKNMKLRKRVKFYEKN